MVFGSFGTAKIALAGNADWTMSGQNTNNWRFQPNETIIDSSNAFTLKPKWINTMAGYMSATPSVMGKSLYIPDSSGNLYDLNTDTGATNWSVNLSEITGTNTYSRTTPTIYGDTLLVGTQNGGNLLAFNKNTGELLWKQQMDNHPYAIITQSPVVANGIAYVGVSSSEEAAAAQWQNSYDCCTFRGSIEAVDIATGQIQWKSYTTPDNGGQPGGYSGAAIWGSTPVVDEKRNSLIVATGNNYEVPKAVETCQANNGSNCDASNNYVDAVLSLNLQTAAINWADKGGSDVSTDACLNGANSQYCPAIAGPDADFAQGPMLIPSLLVAGRIQDVLVAGQKSGAVYGINPDNGNVLWTTQTGPGGKLGGLQWGSATDGHTVYFANSNSAHQSYTLRNGQTITGGFWGALDPATGEILWETADPTGSMDTGPLSVANGLVYVGSMSALANVPNLFILNALTGRIEWNYTAGGSVNSAPAIVDGSVYWGSGYGKYGPGYNNKLYAFEPSLSSPDISIPIIDPEVPEPSSILGVFGVIGLISTLKKYR